jgi:hypothetical protein
VPLACFPLTRRCGPVSRELHTGRTISTRFVVEVIVYIMHLLDLQVDGEELVKTRS